MISKNLAKEVLNAALATGADNAEIFLEETESETIIVDNGKCETSTDSIIYGAGIRLLNKLQSVYGYTNDTSKKGLMALATSLAHSFNEERKLTVTDIKDCPVSKDHQPKIPYSNWKKEDKIAYLLRADKAARGYDKRIIRVQSTFLRTEQKIHIFNSSEKYLTDTRIRGRVLINCFASDGKGIETAAHRPGASKGIEFFTEEINVEEEAIGAAKQAITMLGAAECPSGKMPVIIGNGFGGVLFHEACGHPLEASSVSKGLSVFSGKMGQKVASDIVSAYDDGTIPGAWGSNNIDDEGHKTHNTTLIENGILKSYLVDQFNGRRMNTKENGASRRESYKYEPTSRMSNTYIGNGTSTVEEIIAATKFGLYAKTMGGGSVNPATGEFNFVCNEAYIIKDGKIAYPVKGATLIGNGADLLKYIDMIADDLFRGQGMCGASSGSIPTDVGQPTLRVSQMTVGGRGEVLK